ncbi:hypothetical protein AOR13_36 [Alteromonas stellipolaris LMG 21856]|nr:hypothetical protein AOR13_36 [Alteromonas stellipolaris LMG 21856]
MLSKRALFSIKKSHVKTWLFCWPDLLVRLLQDSLQVGTHCLFCKSLVVIN